MFTKLLSWFESQTTRSMLSYPQHKTELATAVLLYEIMRADDTFYAQEQETFELLLTRHFSLDTEELDTLIELTAARAAEAVDFAQFTRIINDNCDNSEKRKILESLWHIAFADNNLDPHEEYLIRRIADLLHMPHSQFIQSKLAVQDKRQ